VEFYFRVFDEYSKIDFFVWRENAKKIFSSRLCTCIFHILFHENLIFFLEIYYFFFKKSEFLRPKKS